MKNQRKSIWALISLLSLLLLLIIFRPFSWQELVLNLQKFDLVTLCLAGLLAFAQYFFMSLRLHFLVPYPISLLQSCYANFYGQCLNNFLPARGGDIAKSMMIATKSSQRSHDLAQSAGILFSDRVVDISIFLMVVFLTGSVQFVSWDHLTKVFVVGLFVCLVCLVLFRITRIRHWPYWQSVRKGFRQLSQPQALCLSSVAALLCCLCEGFTLMIYARGLGFPISFSESYLAVTVLNLGIAIPISIGNIGPFEAALVYGLGLLSIPHGSGLAIATMHHIMQMLVVAICTLMLSFWNSYQKGTWLKKGSNLVSP